MLHVIALCRGEGISKKRDGGKGMNQARNESSKGTEVKEWGKKRGVSKRCQCVACLAADHCTGQR